MIFLWSADLSWASSVSERRWTKPHSNKAKKPNLPASLASPTIHRNQAPIPRNTWKSTKIYRNLWKSYKSIKIDRKRWKSSDDKKPAWNRAKVSIGAASWALRPLDIHTSKSWTTNEIYENLSKSMKIDGNLWTSIENHESLQVTRSQPWIE